MLNDPKEGTSDVQSKNGKDGHFQREEKNRIKMDISRDREQKKRIDMDISRGRGKKQN